LIRFDERNAAAIAAVAVEVEVCRKSSERHRMLFRWRRFSSANSDSYDLLMMKFNHVLEDDLQMSF
jgi:hypothetical protein